MKSYWKIAIALGAVYILHCGPGSAAGAEFVRREIRFESGSALVEDNVRLDKAWCELSSELHEVVNKVKSGTTNGSEIIKPLLEGEDLEVVQCQAAIKDKMLEIHALSRVKAQPGRGARVHWLLTDGGFALAIAIGSGEESDKELLIYTGSAGTVLWFPEWKTDADPIRAATVPINGHYMFKRLIKVDRDLRLTCSLKALGSVHTLFDWIPESPIPGAADLEFVAMLDQAHKLSGNDLLSLFTGIKLGKPGYYALDTSGFTNRPPILPPGSGPWEVRPMTGSELDAMGAKLHGHDAKKNPQTRFKIDGSFSDWGAYRAAWTNVPPGPRVIWHEGGPSGSSVEIRECDYCNDDNYLYLFFKFSPTIQERFEGSSEKSGIVGWVYLDSGSGTNAEKGRPEILGNDTRIYFPFGTYFVVSGKQSETGPYVDYEIRRWDPARRDFTREVREESSRDPSPLINHGKDGVEVALKLADLRKKKGDTFVLVCEDGADPRGHVHKFKVTLE